MIFVHIDDVTTRNVVGHECGTRSLFDERHGNDPLWLFFDYETIVHRTDISAFLLAPKSFYINNFGLLRKRT